MIILDATALLSVAAIIGAVSSLVWSIRRKPQGASKRSLIKHFG